MVVHNTFNGTAILFWGIANVSSTTIVWEVNDQNFHVKLILYFVVC